MPKGIKAVVCFLISTAMQRCRIYLKQKKEVEKAWLDLLSPFKGTGRKGACPNCVCLYQQ